MRRCAQGIVLGLLVIGWTGSAIAQPFKDSSSVPAWAYDAVAKLAAEGLIQGYPDGTFSGERALTRNEFALVVARLLAKLEAIERQLPAQQRPRWP